MSQVEVLQRAVSILASIDEDCWQDESFWGPPRGGYACGARGGDGTVAQRVQRWIEVTPSQFTHEAEGLNLVRSLLPANAPFRAWSNFEFRDGHGKWHEVDLLVLGRRRLHLVELKYYSGTLRGDDLTWRRDGHRAEDSPLKLARRKAQRLASKLQDELIRFAQETGADGPGSSYGRAVRAGVRLPAPPWPALPAAAAVPDRPVRPGWRRERFRAARDLRAAARAGHAAAVRRPPTAMRSSPR